ncbi:MAG: hypothetical protein WA364_16645, partial [Candidatus Nitrosopolaris sp.]
SFRVHDKDFFHKTVNMFLPGNVYNGFRKFWQYCQNWNLQTLALFSFSSFITFFPQNIEEKVPLLSLYV